MKDMIFKGNRAETENEYTLLHAAPNSIELSEDGNDVKIIDWSDDRLRDLEPTEAEKDRQRYLMINEVTDNLYILKAFGNYDLFRLVGMHKVDRIQETGQYVQTITVNRWNLNVVYEKVLEPTHKYLMESELFKIFAEGVQEYIDEYERLHPLGDD